MKLNKVVCTALACLGFGLASCNQAPATPTRNPEQTMKDFCKVFFELEGEAKVDEDYMKEEDYFWTAELVFMAEESEDALAWELICAVYYVAESLPSYMSFDVSPDCYIAEDDSLIGLGSLASDDKKVSAEVLTYVTTYQGMEVIVGQVVTEAYVDPAK